MCRGRGGRVRDRLTSMSSRSLGTAFTFREGNKSRVDMFLFKTSHEDLHTGA